MNTKLWNIIKDIAISIIAIMFIILTVQFVSLGSLNNKNNTLSKELEDLSNQYIQKQETKNNLENNYSQFVEDECKEKYDMKNEKEEVLVVKQD